MLPERLKQGEYQHWKKEKKKKEYLLIQHFSWRCFLVIFEKVWRDIWKRKALCNGKIQTHTDAHLWWKFKLADVPLPALSYAHLCYYAPHACMIWLHVVRYSLQCKNRLNQFNLTVEESTANRHWQTNGNQGLNANIGMHFNFFSYSFHCVHIYTHLYVCSKKQKNTLTHTTHDILKAYQLSFEYSSIFNSKCLFILHIIWAFDY